MRMVCVFSGLSMVRTGQAEGALVYLRRARRFQPQNPLTHLHYGVALFALRRPVRAAALFRRAAMLDPKSTAAWINLSSAILALLGDLGWYMREHERLMAHGREASSLSMLDVSLEDWVRDFRATLERVLGFLGLQYDSACETFYPQTRRVRTASAGQVRQPLNARGLGRWKRFEKHLEKHLAPMLEELEQLSRGDVAESVD